LVDQMSEFLERAQKYQKDFAGLPPAIHPRWKGFPVHKLQKFLDKLTWGESSSEESVSRERIGSFNEHGFSIELSGSKWSLEGNLPEGLQFSEFKKPSEKFLKHSEADGFNDLRSSLSDSGIQIEVGSQYKNQEPLVLTEIGGKSDQWISPLRKIRVKEGATLELVLVFQNLEGLLSPLIQIELEPGSRLEMIQWASGASKECLSRIEVRQEAFSHFEFSELDHGVERGRSEVHVELVGKEAQSKVSGIHLLSGEDLFDSRVRMVHVSPETYSHQNFKCVAAGKSQSLFGGDIIIEKDAQRVNSSQVHKALLISKTAKANAYPELEIHADDVKAAHGSSTGQLDPEQIFYLKSRGLSLGDATHLLSEAFVNDVVLKISSAKLRSVFRSVLKDVLPDYVKQMESKWRQS